MHMLWLCAQMVNVQKHQEELWRWYEERERALLVERRLRRISRHESELSSSSTPRSSPPSQPHSTTGPGPPIPDEVCSTRALVWHLLGPLQQSSAIQASLQPNPNSTKARLVLNFFSRKEEG